MITVVLRNGKVLQYNEAKRVYTLNNCFSIQPDSTHLIAKFPMDVVERIEFEKPCKILKAKKIPKRAKTY